MNEECVTCSHKEMDHIVDPMSKIAWCGFCGDEFIPQCDPSDGSDHTFNENCGCRETD